ncbi:MAG: Rpn family recombination-promoting nuclease/putative transposase [candidate division KSB1 bacterium]|nr:Rpn family recombination-promoting nuclease/putative transposase [candidate division KSB1 bacterium]MDZ7366742.1 Rpn family recombination-promoting nuclease/putative transposase [candidate division KSB1 bacterium]MDZ7404755.1 Rpn family recombination-promoting nuclease/putative transposase [candidate division KSB1 bacterium]
MATDKPFYKLAIKHPVAILKLLGVFDGDDCVASSITFKATENRRDLIFKNRTGDKILFVEVHGYADPYVYHGQLDGIMMYCCHKQFKGEFRAAVIFLENSHHKAALKLAHHFDGHAQLAFQPMVLIMNQIELEALESLNDVRLIPLYPLCKVTSRQIEASIPAWGDRIKHAEQMSIAERKELLSLLGGFVSHRVKRLAPKVFNQLVGGFMFEDTRFGKELMGMGSRSIILEQIAHRFGTVPDDVRRRLERIYDIKRLKRIGSRLLEVENLKQLKQLIDPNGKSTAHEHKGLKKKGAVKAQHGVSR